MTATRVEILAIGDELLSGARVNSNAAWLGANLGAVGAEVVRGTVVGDDVDGIVAAMRVAAERSDLVVTTGGLGPTADDRTRDALAIALGVPLVVDDETARRIARWYEVRGRTPLPEVLRQADVPEGASALRNDVGTAPGLRARLGGADIVCLPGVPSEMTAIMTGSVLPDLLERSGGGLEVASLRTALVPETVLAHAIADVERRAVAAGVRVAYLPSIAEVVVRFVAPPGTPPGLVDAFAAEAVDLIGDRVVSSGDVTLAEEVLRLARASQSTVAVAESLTGGAVASSLAAVAGASDVLRGGVVAYATDLKSTLLGVDPVLLDAVGPVDGRVARAMAEGVRSRLGGSYGLATTGVAGPDGQGGHPPGTVHVAVAGPDRVEVRSITLAGDRDRIRSASVVHVLELARRLLRGLPVPD